MPGKRLYRSYTDRKIAGVCGGIAEYFDIDPVFVRIGAFLVTIPHGFGILIYLICWAAIPLRPGEEAAQAEAAARTGSEPPATAAAPSDAAMPGGAAYDSPVRTTKGNGELIAGGILILLGFFFLLFNVGLFDMELFRFWRWRFVWPVILIALGLYVVATSLRTARRGAGKGAL